MSDLTTKVNDLATAVTRLQRRARKHVYGLISPIPISRYSDNLETDVIRFMFPASGTISNILVFIEDFPKDGVTITAELYSGTHVDSKQTLLTKKSVMLKDGFDVSPGDRIVVKGANVKDPAKGVWISFLWTPKIDYVESMKYVISNLEKSMKEDAENAKEAGGSTET